MRTIKYAVKIKNMLHPKRLAISGTAFIKDGKSMFRIRVIKKKYCSLSESENYYGTKYPNIVLFINGTEGHHWYGAFPYVPSYQMTHPYRYLDVKLKLKNFKEANSLLKRIENRRIKQATIQEGIRKEDDIEFK